MTTTDTSTQSPTMRHIAIIGAGTMGSGIAQVMAQNGYDVTLVDVAQEPLERGVQHIERGLARLVARERMTADERDAALQRIKSTTELAQAASADLMLEAVVEKREIKRAVLTALDQDAPPETILASNTSSISISELAAMTGRPERVIGIHFMNPAPVMQLVEVIRGLDTSDETYRRAVALAESVGKQPVTIQDSPGFALNRLLIPMINEAAFVLMEGVASAEDIDRVMTLGANHPMGPLALADLIGLDTCLAIMEVLHQELGEDKYRPCPLLRRMVAAQRLGRKSGHGFYDYGERTADK